MKIIILAAGLGARLQEVLRGKPKPLLKLNRKSLIERSLAALSKNMIEEVLIAVGFKEEMIKKEIGEEFEGMKIKYVENKIYERTGSMHSFYLALKEPEDCLVLDGDIVYEPAIISEFLNYDKENAVILTNCCGSGDELYTLLNENNQVTYLGKDRPDNENSLEAIGISKFSKQFTEKMFELHKQNLVNNQLEEYCEDCAYRASKFIPWYGFIKKDLYWSEIDRKEDVERAMKALEFIEGHKF